MDVISCLMIVSASFLPPSFFIRSFDHSVTIEREKEGEELKLKDKSSRDISGDNSGGEQT